MLVNANDDVRLFGMVLSHTGSFSRAWDHSNLKRLLTVSMKYLIDPNQFWLALPAMFLIGTLSGKLISHFALKLTDYLYEKKTQFSYSGIPHSLKNWLVPFSAPVIANRKKSREFLDLPSFSTHQRWTEFFTGLIFSAFFVFYFYLNCQKTPEVVPSEFWYYGRFLFHLVFISLLIAATATDFRDYVIPDQIVIPGMIFAVSLAAISGQLQIIHIWVDWNHPLVEVYGPYLPPWLDSNRHLHGFAWSAVGLLAGGGITWFARVTSRWILGREALGFGDVTLMGMIGSFLGWQPVLVVFVLAPLVGIFVAIGIRLITGRSFLAYGPFLCASAIIVLFTWKWIWEATKSTYGDAISIAILLGFAMGMYLILLLLLRIYHAIPGKERPEEPVFSSDEE